MLNILSISWEKFNFWNFFLYFQEDCKNHMSNIFIQSIIHVFSYFKEIFNDTLHETFAKKQKRVHNPSLSCCMMVMPLWLTVAALALSWPGSLSLPIELSGLCQNLYFWLTKLIEEGQFTDAWVKLSLLLVWLQTWSYDF